jgi:lipid II:glycine glycyltransferase (peptidoglycan interpeptide bridge formation enzyme)
MNGVIRGTAPCAELRQADIVIDPERRHSASGLSVLVDGKLAGDWADIIGNFADATYSQVHLLAGQVWGHGNLSHIAIRHGTEIIAASQVVLQRVPLFGRGVAFIKFGPLWRRKNRTARPEALHAALAAIKEEYAVRRRLMIVVLPTPDPVHGGLVEDVLVEQGFAVRRRMSDPNRYLVDTRLGEAQQLASLNQKWRYNLRKALGAKLEISIHGDLDGIERFMPIFRAMQARKGYDDKQASLALPAMMRELPREQQPWVIMARHEGCDTAGCIVGTIGDTAYYLFGATDVRALKLNAGYALQWKAIEFLRRRPSVRWYDLGGEANDQGLRQFKKGLAGSAGKVVRFSGEFEYCTDRMSQFVVDQALRLRDLRRRFRGSGNRPPREPVERAAVQAG